MESLLNILGNFLKKFDENKSNSYQIELYEKAIQILHVLIVMNGFFKSFSLIFLGLNDSQTQQASKIFDNELLETFKRINTECKVRCQEIQNKIKKSPHPIKPATTPTP